METPQLVSYVFFTGFISGSVFMYTGLMMFLSGMATGIVCSRSGWVDTAYERFNSRDWVDFNMHIAKIFSKQ